jgi:hypothetical protein
MAVPEVVDRAYVSKLWVGRENYQTFSSYFKETAAWQKQAIWEQRNGDSNGTDDDLPTHTGTEHATQAQIEHILGICEAKSIDVKELVLTATNGASNNPGTLTKTEASEIIETAKAY